MKENLGSHVKSKAGFSKTILWLEWTLATGIGWLIGWRIVNSQFAMDVYGTLVGSNEVLGNTVAGFIDGTFIGIIISLAQWYVISNLTFRLSQWLLVNAVGWGIAFALGSLASWITYSTCLHSWCFNVIHPVVFTVKMLVVGIVLGFGVGYIQSLSKHNQIFEVRLWRLASAIGWMVALFAIAGHAIFIVLIGIPVFSSNVEIDLLNAIGTFIFRIAGFTAGGITGIALIKSLEKFQIFSS